MIYVRYIENEMRLCAEYTIIYKVILRTMKYLVCGLVLIALNLLSSVQKCSISRYYGAPNVL